AHQKAGHMAAAFGVNVLDDQLELFGAGPQREPVVPGDVEEGRYEELLGRGKSVAAGERAYIAVGLAEGVVDLVNDAPQGAAGPGAKPDRDRSEAVAQHAGEGDQPNGSPFERDASRSQPPLSPGPQRHGRIARAMIGFPE